MQDGSPGDVRRAQKDDGARPSDRLALGSALAGGLIVAVVLGTPQACSGGQSRARADGTTAAPSSQPSRAEVGPRTTAVPSVSAVSPTPTRLAAASDRARVANTDGQGVVLRGSPRDEDRTPRGFMDGEMVTVLERNGNDWVHVRGDNGQEGWVPSRYLGP